MHIAVISLVQRLAALNQGIFFQSCHSPWFLKDIFYAFSSLLSDRPPLLVSHEEAFPWRSDGTCG